MLVVAATTPASQVVSSVKQNVISVLKHKYSNCIARLAAHTFGIASSCKHMYGSIALHLYTLAVVEPLQHTVAAAAAEGSADEEEAEERGPLPDDRREDGPSGRFLEMPNQFALK